MPLSSKLFPDPFSPFYDELYAYALKRLGQADMASDLVHDAFARVLRQKGDCEIEQPRAYLYRVLINLIHDHGRRARRALKIDVVEQLDCYSSPAATPTPAEALESSEATERLQRAIRELPPKCREVFSMHRFQGLRHREIARRLHISQSTVEKHIAAALVRLRRELADFFQDAD